LAWDLGAKTGFFCAEGCLIACVFAWFFVPETKDRPTTEIDVLFENRFSPRKFNETPIEIQVALHEGNENKAI